MKRFLILCALLFSQSVFADRTHYVQESVADETQLPLLTHHFTLKQLTHQDALTLRGLDGIQSVDFGARANEIVTHVVLHLRYSYSPALIPLQSHIKIKLNDEVVAVLPITRENGGKLLSSDIEMDPALIADFNRIQLEFIGHYTPECEDPVHSSLWTEISGASDLELSARPILLKNELSILPEPFFDRRDSRQLKLPFVFSPSPSRTTLNAAGIVSSWFGKLAAWRGARFPANLNLLPKGQAVVFASANALPAFLAQHSRIEGPMLEIMTNPADGYSKLLLVLGRDDNDLMVAAKALVLGDSALSGPSAAVKEVKDKGPREAYDAPNWVRMDRAMKFGELVASPQDLQVYGHVSNPIRINMTVPPDLFTWHSRGVPVDLKFRYTPPIHPNTESRMVMGINDELVESFNLKQSGRGGESARVRLPLLDDLLFGESKEVFVPAFKLGAHNQMQYNFSFSYVKEGNCKDSLVENVRSQVDADSTIDFSGFPHYAEMPNLNYFVSAGYPFTKYADLSETVVVMPDVPSAYDIETMLTLLGRMGESTGYPAIRVRVAAAENESLFKNADLLVIGTAAKQRLLSLWASKLPSILAGNNSEPNQPARNVNLNYDRLGFNTAPDPTIFSEEKFKTTGALAAMLGFESPVSSGRSVVAVTAVGAEQLPTVLDALDDPGLARDIQGSVAFVHPQKVESLLVGSTYYVGHLPFLTAIWYPLSKHPVVLAILSVLALLLFAFALGRTFKAIEAKRMRGDS